MTFDPRLILSAAALALLFAVPVRAADYDPPIVVDQAPEYVPVEVGSGWYLRGDVTYNFNRSPYDLESIDGIDASSTRFGGGGGVGYHFTDVIRGDLNIGFLSRDEIAFATPDVSARFENQVWSGMANAYFDLGTIVGITPYIGGGVGLLYSRNTADIEAGGFGSAEFKDKQYEFAYSLAAGVNYKLTPNASVDLGYQYLSSPGTEYLDARSGTFAVDKGLDFHQIKVGLRYDLW